VDRSLHENERSWDERRVNSSQRRCSGRVSHQIVRTRCLLVLPLTPTHSPAGRSSVWSMQQSTRRM
jgi:hypothetical protein